MGAKERIYEYLENVGRGKTDLEIAKALALPVASTRRARRVLQMEGSIEPGEDREVGGRKPITTWVACDQSPTAEKKVCPLCSGKGWIVRAPAPDPIPFLGVKQRFLDIDKHGS